MISENVMERPDGVQIVVKVPGMDIHTVILIPKDQYGKLNPTELSEYLDQQVEPIRAKLLELEKLKSSVTKGPDSTPTPFGPGDPVK